LRWNCVTATDPNSSSLMVLRRARILRQSFGTVRSAPL
jgi:hypothetical protein